MQDRYPKRQKRELLALLLALFLTFSSVIVKANLALDSPPAAEDAFATSAEEPLFPTDSLTLSAESAALLTADGTLLLGKDPHKRMGMASTTKIMTGLLAAEAIREAGLEATHTVNPTATGVEGSSIYLEAGETVRLTDLLYATLLASANDAATALAEAVSGSVGDFVSAMNRRAEAYGLANTHFENPHGLASENHYTTAYDLAILAAKALENPLFAQVVATGQYHFTTDKSARSFTNHNRLLTSYEGACGVKTGFTRATGRCLVSAAERDGVKLIAVTLSAPDDWEDHRALLDFGFAHTYRLALAESGGIRHTVPLLFGGEVTLTNRESLTLILPKTHGVITCQIQAPPVAFSAADCRAVAQAVFYEKGIVIATLPLSAAG